MTSRPRTTRIKLSWKQIECRRCHEVRVVGIPCPTCSARPDPREVDPNLQRRQRLARDALAILDRPPEPHTTSRPVLDQWSPEQGLGPLADWLEQFLPALNAAIDDASAAPRLFELVATLVDLRHEVGASQWLRPHLPLWHTADTLIGRLTDVAHHYLLACAAPTPLQAQAAEKAGQQALDAGADDSSDLAERLDRWERITTSDRVGDIIAALAVETYRLAGTSDLLVLEDAGSQDFEQLLGSACPSGMGFLLLFMSLQAEVILDQQRFRQLARDAHALLTQQPGRLQQLVQDDVLVEDMEDAVRRGYDAAITAQAVLAAAGNDRQAIRALLALAHELLEGPGKRQVAALLAVAGRRSYQHLRRDDAGALLQQASQQPSLAPLLGGLDIALRDAKAHEDYLIEGDELILTDRGIRRSNTPPISGLVLVDRVLTALETIQALFFALAAAAAKVDVMLVDALDYSHFDMADEDVLAMLLGLQSWTDVTVEIDEGTLRAVASGEFPAPSLRPVAILVPHLPEPITQLQLTLHTSSGLRLLAGPTEPWRRYNGSTGWEKQLDFVECCRRWHLDGRPAFDQDQVRLWAARQALEHAAAGYPACVKPLRQLHRLAQRLQDDDLASDLRELTTYARNASMGLAPEDEGSDVVSRLQRWALANVPVPAVL
jgi:hypothetical protein